MATRSTAVRAFAFGGAALAAFAVSTRSAGPSSAAPRQRPAAQSGRFADECLSEHPFFVTTRFNAPDGTIAPALVAFRWTLTGGERYTLAREEDVGAVYGLAVDDAENDVYAGAYVKRGTRLHDGTGAIFRLDLDTGLVETWATVPGAGADPHDLPGAWPDIAAGNAAGERGLGDLDLSLPDRTLFAVNLADRRIYRYRLDDRRLDGSFPHGAAAEPWAAGARPFGLKAQGGRLFHGVVDASGASDPEGRPMAYVYRSLLGGGQMTRVLALPLDYARGDARQGVPADWAPWRRGHDTRDPDRLDAIWPQPVLADIEITDEGHLVLGLRDRFGDMTLHPPAHAPPTPELPGLPAGDLLLGRIDGAGWAVTPEPEFFAADAGPGFASNRYGEIAYGGLARPIVRDWTVTSAMAPVEDAGAGAIWFDNADGAGLVRLGLTGPGAIYTFSEDNALGDVERLCGRLEAPTPFAPPTPAPTRTPSSTPTASSTPSPTPTATPTATSTSTPTPTSTPTATASHTPTSTPTDTPTPTATDTATATPTPTDTPTSTPTSTATATATPTIRRVYLPLSQRPSGCTRRTRYADVALVLDRSTSMRRTAGAGSRTKDDAAIDAARDFVGRLELAGPGAAALRGDRVAVVGFHDAAWTALGPTGDRHHAIATLAAMRGRLAEGTRLDLALAEGRAGLAAAARPDRVPVLVLLTDGLPNRVPTPVPSGRQEDTVLAIARSARAAGLELYAIGLGQSGDVSPALLAGIAGSAERAFVAPEAHDLARIYAAIAARVTRCP